MSIIKKATLLASIYAGAATLEMNRDKSLFQDLPKLSSYGQHKQHKTQLNKTQRKARAASKLARKARSKQYH